MADMHRDTLDLNHKLNNPLFASWKLSRALSVSEQTVTLNGHVSTSEHNPDYLNTRAAVLHNHINHQHGRLYIFCISAESLSLQEICQPQATVLKTVWGMSPCNLQAAYGALGTVQELTRCAEPSQAIQTANPNTKHGASMQPSVVELQPLEPTHVGRQLLVSTGQGDVSLLKTAETTSMCQPTAILCYAIALSWLVAECDSTLFP